jgi:hypothetical protein
MPAAAPETMAVLPFILKSGRIQSSCPIFGSIGIGEKVFLWGSKTVILSILKGREEEILM